MTLRAALGLVLGLAGCPAAPARAEPPEVGVASWYGPRHHGRRTANGARFDMHALTAAHRSLPFGTVIRVTNLRNRRTVSATVTDRGPYLRGRIIDLSAGAAKAIGMERQGLAVVRITVER